MSHLHDIAKALSKLAGPGIRAGARRIDPGDLSGLHPVELARISRAVPSRRHEFATGRQLLRSLIGEDVAIPVGPSREPLLPAGLVGSLAHDHAVAVGVVAEKSTVLAVGVDLECVGPMVRQERDLVFRSDDPDIEPRLAFVLKEATYKAWSGIGGRLLDFRDVQLTAYESSFSAAIFPERRVIDGRWSLVDGRWVGLACVPGSSAHP